MVKDWVYSREWFLAHNALKSEYRAVAEVIHELFANEASDCIDVGCGMGLIIERLQELAWSVSGLDGAEAVKSCAPESVRDSIFAADLTAPLPPMLRYGLVICTEVAEHLEPQFADVLVDNVCGLGSGPIFWTAALKGQGGTDHLNEQDPPYWIEKFVARGRTLDEPTTTKCRAMLRERVTGMRWMWHSVAFR